MDLANFEVEFGEAPLFTLRPYQTECINAVREGWREYNRLLIVMATGGGKTVCFSMIAQEEVAKGGRVLILAHTDELLEQAIDKLRKSTGIHADKEKADQHASPYAQVVVASIQSLSRINRLTGFSDNHFSLVIVDETHRILSPSYIRVTRYFHWGSESLAEGWVMPEPGAPYQHKARVLGVTATADRGDKRSLGEFYQHCCFEWGLLEACRDGWLVRPIVKNIPLKIDLKRRSKEEKITRGGDYAADFLVARMEPVLKAIAEEIAKHAGDRKAVCFLPSIETASLMADALTACGLNASFVSGACDNRDEKIVDFDSAPNGSAICCAMLLTEGWDCPSASCICVLRPTKIRSLFVQCAGRATRTLTGLIDGLETREERLAAIANSAKPDMLILDFLWVTDRLDLVSPIDLVAIKPEIRERMVGLEGDLVAAEAVAERDMLKALEKAAKKHARREARTIDPIAWAVSLGDVALATWEPETKWDSDPITPGQADFLRKNGIDPTNVKFKGLASKIVNRVITRLKLGLASVQQLSFMAQLGLDEQKCATLTRAEATATIDAVLKAKRGVSSPT